MSVQSADFDVVLGVTCESPYLGIHLGLVGTFVRCQVD